MSIYTNKEDIEDIYFLNDKNLVDSIDGDVAVNAVPTMKLVHDSYNNLSSMADQVSAYLSDMNNTASLVGSDGYMSVLTEIGQNKAELCSKATTLLSSHVKGLSEFVEAASAAVDNKVWLSVNYISGQADLSAASLSDAILKEIYIKDRTSTEQEYVDGKYSNLSVVKITLDEYKKLVKDQVSQLKSNCLYVIDTDHLEGYGQQLKNLAEPIDLSDATTKNYVDVRDNAIYVDLIEKIDDVNENITTEINKLNVSEIAVGDGQIFESISEAKGKIQATVRALNANDIPTLPESKIANLTADLNNLSSNYVKIDDFKSNLSSQYTFFDYVFNDHALKLTIADKTLSVNTANFERGRLLSAAGVVTRDNVKYLLLVFKLEDGTPNFVEIKVTDFATMYQGSDTISIDDTMAISVKDTVALKTDISALTYADTILDGAKLMTELKEDKGVISYLTKDPSLADIIDLNTLYKENIITGGVYKIITQLNQINGKISYDVADLNVSCINDYDDATDEKITDAIAELNSAAYPSESDSGLKKFIRGIELEDGKITSVSSNIVTSADIDMFGNAVDDRIDAKTNDFRSTLTAAIEAGKDDDYLKFYTSIVQNDGILSDASTALVISANDIKYDDISSLYDKINALQVENNELSSRLISAANYISDSFNTEAEIDIPLLSGLFVKLSCAFTGTYPVAE